MHQQEQHEQLIDKQREKEMKMQQTFNQKAYEHYQKLEEKQEKREKAQFNVYKA